MVHKLHVIDVYHLGKLERHLPVGEAARSQFFLCLEYIDIKETLNKVGRGYIQLSWTDARSKRKWLASKLVVCTVWIDPALRLKRIWLVPVAFVMRNGPGRNIEFGLKE